MKRLILALLLTTPLLSAKHLYMGHFTGCSLTNVSHTKNLVKPDFNCVEQFIEHSFTQTSGTQWIFCTDNDFVTYHWYIDNNYQFSVFIDIRFDEKSEKNKWLEVEKEIAYILTPTNISRKVIELK